MKFCDRKNGIRPFDYASLFFCTLFFLLTGLLGAWGTPEWFSRFPYSAGLRFLLALGLYFLCCVLFFAFRISVTISAASFRFARSFCLSFIAVPIFSVLVLCNTPIQTLQTFSAIADCFIWFSVSLLMYRKKMRSFIFPLLFFASGAVLLLPPVPSILVILFRFLVLSVFSLMTFPALFFRATENLQDVAARFRLSPRETDVLALLVEGKTNNEIAEILFISLSTVKTHIASIFEKTGSKSRLEVSARCKKP